MGRFPWSLPRTGLELSPRRQLSGMVSSARGWYYQSRTGVTNRTVTSALTMLARWERSKTTGRTETAGTSSLVLRFINSVWPETPILGSGVKR